MADVKIPREAVEAAARAMSAGDWDNAPTLVKHKTREFAMDALNAAAYPLLLGNLHNGIIREATALVLLHQNKVDSLKLTPEAWNAWLEQADEFLGSLRATLVQRLRHEEILRTEQSRGQQ